MNESSERKNFPSEKRKKKFHNLFKSISKNEELQYSCPSLLRDNSKYFQGRLYISTEHLSFYSKNIFANTTIILKLKTILGIELKKSIFLTGSLDIITYDKTYSFKSLFYKEELYPIILYNWQKVMGISSHHSSMNYNLNSIFKIDIPRPSKIVEERAISEEERVFNIDMRTLLKRIVDTDLTKTFYKTLTNDKIYINTYMNRRTIQFYNEYIDEVYSVDGNTLNIEYHSRGTLCRIKIVPCSKHQVKVKIVEKYNYTTLHYYKYIEVLCEHQVNSIFKMLPIFGVFLVMMVKLVTGIGARLRGLHGVTRKDIPLF
ncbi:hypothetical protein NEAUS04_0670 [Nematocida ausubeli]|nr:hypothetical protein NEAUS07_0843 [Nematocida ausubeli]KAI5134863.1 hypothetical protein NEAUS06_1364 [Nematocida ausubeli]KAI5161695.1 hypothetical protein NEAUS04_0670 [Nematocida ausubeli]